MYESLALIISSVSAIAAAIGLVFNGLSHREETKSNYHAILKDLEADSKQVEDKDDGSEDAITDIINFHEKLAFLFFKKIISYDVISYFDDGCGYALFLLQNSEDMNNPDIYENFRKYCNKYKIKPSDD